MNYSPELLLPVAAAAAYCLSVLFVKASTADGKLSPTSILATTNFLMFLAFLPTLLCNWQSINPHLLWQPLLTGIFFAIGNWATFQCSHKGEVSLMTPIMGIKILLVILFLHTIVGGETPKSLIFAGLLCCAAVFIMGYSKSDTTPRGKRLWTYALAAIACISYAMCDVLFQKFTGNFDGMIILSLNNIVLAILSVPYIKTICRDFRNANNKTLALGTFSAILMTVEAVLMVIAIIGEVGAGLCNILYNTRGIMSVLLILAAGRINPSLRELNKASTLRRLTGSAMIMLAVYTALA